ncbi:MFS transporter [Kytococcus sp. Marseille-QA3725]
MPGTTRAGSYRTLLSRPHVLRPVLLAAAGRLGYAMLPLLLLFTVRDAAASFTTATAAMSAFGLAGLLMPAKARAIDRYGQARVLPVLGLATLVAIGAVVALAATGTALPHAVWIALAGAAGVAAPPLGPSMRALWRTISPEDTDTAYTLDGTMEEVLWLAGPALSGVLLASTGPTAGLAITPLLLVVGSVGLATSPWRPRPHAAEDRSSTRSALRSRALWPVLVTMALTGVSTALVLTGIAAAADAVGHRGLAAVGEVSLGIGAVLGGLSWGHRRPAWSARRSVITLVLFWSATVAVVRVLGISALSLPLLTMAGAASAPVWVLAYGAADRAVDESERTEASTWATTTANLGSSAGTALTGGFVATAGTLSPLAAAAAVAVATAGATLTWPRSR